MWQCAIMTSQTGTNDTQILQTANAHASKNGRYYYIEVLGRGGFGAVLKAQDQMQGRKVAVKIIQSEKSLKQFVLRKTSAATKDGQKEANLLMNLPHANVIALQDHFKFKIALQKSGFAIVMDYCSKGNLQSHLEQLIDRHTRSLKITKKEKWCQQLATALEFIHQQNVVHRDLKPENILVDDAENLKVADVGIAKALCDEQGTSVQEYMQTVAGTPLYMAPEVWEGHYTKSSDVFSLGLVMFLICELPDPLVPMAHISRHLGALGQFMHMNRDARCLTATLLLNANKCTSDEKKLFNDMLQCRYQSRPAVGDVIRKLKEMEKRRAEQWNWRKCNVM